jgi:hypothetical protein
MRFILFIAVILSFVFANRNSRSRGENKVTNCNEAIVRNGHLKACLDDKTFTAESRECQYTWKESRESIEILHEQLSELNNPYFGRNPEGIEVQCYPFPYETVQISGWTMRADVEFNEDNSNFKITCKSGWGRLLGTFRGSSTRILDYLINYLDLNHKKTWFGTKTTFDSNKARNICRIIMMTKSRLYKQVPEEFEALIS